MEKTNTVEVVEVAAKELPKGKFLTEKGLVKVAVRENFKKQVLATDINLGDWELANDNSLIMPIAQDLGGETIYARVQLTITAQDTFYTGKKKVKDDEVVEVPKLSL